MGMYMIFSVVCNTVDVNDIVEVHKHLMFKFINKLLFSYKGLLSH